MFRKKLRMLIVTIVFIVIAILCFTSVSYSAEKFVRKYRKDIDLTHDQTDVKVGRYTIRADMSRPAKPFREIVFRFHIERNGVPVSVENGIIKFNMIMDMGLYKTRLQKAATGYSAKIVLPKCIFGGERWFAKLTFDEGDYTAEKVFLFDMDKK